MIFKLLAVIAIGLGGGIVISGGVFAFIAIIGIVPRLAQKTQTTDKIMIYEEAIIFGGIFGCLTMFMNFSINIGRITVIALSICNGIFLGCLAISLAEVLDVIPILVRRTRLHKGIRIFLAVLALGKLIGSLMYFLIPGFYSD